MNSIGRDVRDSIENCGHLVVGQGCYGSWFAYKSCIKVIEY